MIERFALFDTAIGRCGIVAPFHQRVFAIARPIPAGATLTYHGGCGSLDSLRSLGMTG
ncbi:MAG TPA: hypothetical protein VFS59_13890 [Gemmatimonadaceae bacterium]|nr:hypothetical protein [Gemmatimonadaceae bacterium]